MTQNVRATRQSWADLEFDSPMPLVKRQRLVGHHAMLSRFELGAGCDVPRHQHANEQFAVVLSGKVRFMVGQPDGPDEEIICGGGEVLHLPPDVPHSAHALEDAVVIDVFSPPSETTGVDG